MKHLRKLASNVEETYEEKGVKLQQTFQEFEKAIEPVLEDVLDNHMPESVAHPLAACLSRIARKLAFWCSHWVM